MHPLVHRKGSELREAFVFNHQTRQRMKQETVPQKVPNVILFLTKSCEAKEKRINAVHFFTFK